MSLHIASFNTGKVLGSVLTTAFGVTSTNFTDLAPLVLVGLYNGEYTASCNSLIHSNHVTPLEVHDVAFMLCQRPETYRSQLQTIRETSYPAAYVIVSPLPSEGFEMGCMAEPGKITNLEADGQKRECVVRLGGWLPCNTFESASMPLRRCVRLPGSCRCHCSCCCLTRSHRARRRSDRQMRRACTLRQTQMERQIFLAEPPVQHQRFLNNLGPQS